MDAVLMDADFTPPTQGRRPIVELDDILSLAGEHPANWVGKVYSASHAASAIRQLRVMRKTHNIDYASRKEPDGRITVFLRVNE